MCRKQSDATTNSGEVLRHVWRGDWPVQLLFIILSLLTLSSMWDSLWGCCFHFVLVNFSSSTEKVLGFLRNSPWTFYSLRLCTKILRSLMKSHQPLSKEYQRISSSLPAKVLGSPGWPPLRFAHEFDTSHSRKRFDIGDQHASKHWQRSWNP